MDSLESILLKIENKTVTIDDFNQLISEATPESVRDRIRRRQNPNQSRVRRHQDENGHTTLHLPTMADRVQPKRERSGRTQMQHRGKLGHRHSARTQRQNNLKEAIEFFRDNIGKSINEELITNKDHDILRTVATKLLSKPNINREWLFDFLQFLG